MKEEYEETDDDRPKEEKNVESTLLMVLDKSEDTLQVIGLNRETPTKKRIFGNTSLVIIEQKWKRKNNKVESKTSSS